jgi:hypothetical protein
VCLADVVQHLKLKFRWQTCKYTWLIELTAPRTNNTHARDYKSMRMFQCTPASGNITDKYKWGKKNRFWKCPSSFISKDCSSFSCGCKKWSLTLREEHTIQHFGNKFRKIFGPTRDDVTWGSNLEYYITRNCVICTGQIVLMAAQSVQWLGYGLDDRGSISGRGKEGIFLFPLSYPSVMSNGYRDIIPGGKRQGHKADHSPPSSSAPPYVFMAWCLFSLILSTYIKTVYFPEQ